MKYLFPSIMFLCSLGASITYTIQLDWRRAVYWAAAAVITAAVTV